MNAVMQSRKRREWSDQPPEVETLPIIFRVFADNRILEVRADEKIPHAYITVGNLFGSQTLRCCSLFVALTTLNLIAHIDPKAPANPPPGTTLIGGPTSPEDDDA